MAKIGATIEGKNDQAVQLENLQFMVSLGMDRVRDQIHVNKIQTTQGGAYDWSEVDRQVSLIKSTGLKLNWPIQQFNTWDMQANCSSLPTPAAMYAFTALAYQRYGTEVDIWECLNEEPAWEDNRAMATTENYLTIFNACYQALVDNGFKGTLGSWGLTGPFIKTASSITDWFTRFLAGSPHTTDLGIHTYFPGDPTVASDKPAIADILAAVRAAGNTTLPINLGEFGYNIQDPTKGHIFTQQQQSDYEQAILQALYNDSPNNRAYVYTCTPFNEAMTIYVNHAGTIASAMFQQWIASH